MAEFDVWSGTDYNKNTTSFTKRENIESTTEWCFNGERSLKLTRRTEEYNGYTTEYYQTLPQGNYLTSIKVYSPESSGQITVFTASGNNVNVGYVKHSDIQTILLSVTNEGIIGLRVSIYGSQQSVYLDSISITAQ